MNSSNPDPESIPQPAFLKKQVGIAGATMMGLGSIIGTGIFVSIGIAAGVTGSSVLLAIAVAAVVATCNGMSSAQLAANHPVSGGTYEYGYRWLHPSLGFSAGWMFLCAKSASAATAALGFAGYFLNLISIQNQVAYLALAFSTVIILTALVLTGIRRSNLANMVIVSITLISLLLFILAGLSSTLNTGSNHFKPFFSPPDGSTELSGFLEACALMFVAYTGYGRIATLGEEIHEPRTSIPKAILITLVVSMILYLLVGLVSIVTVGPGKLSEFTSGQAAPLELIAGEFGYPWITTFISLGACTAMLGVLLNLILGLSRVALAMGRRGDLPRFFSQLDRTETSPVPAVILVGVIIAGIVLVGNVKTTWSFSAFTVLIYYALTNLSAIRLSPEERLYSPVFPWMGLFSCVFLAFWVESSVWLTGLGLLALGILYQKIIQGLHK